MKKRMLSLLLCLVLVLSLMPTAAFAAVTYGLWIGGVQVTSANSTDVLGDGTVSYNPQTKELTLQDTVINGGNDTQTVLGSAGIYSESDITIVAKGTNTINAEYGCGIYSKDDITVTGDGNMIVNSQLNGINGENITIADSTVATFAKSTGIRAKRNVLISDSIVYAISAEAIGICSGYYMTFSGSGYVRSTAANAGMNAELGSITISGDIDVETVSYVGIKSCGAVFSGSGDLTIDAESIGISCIGDMNISGSGDVTVSSKNIGVSTYGNLNLSGSGEVDIYGAGDGVLLWHGESGGVSKVFLNGTSPSIKFSTQIGHKAVSNTQTAESPVAGTNFNRYNETGAPDTSSVVYTPKPGAAISSQPKNVTAAEPGSTVTFSVAASGNGLKYQWQYKPLNSTTWSNSTSVTTGYNTAALHVTATAARNGYSYRCVITDADGIAVTSNAAILTVKNLAITTQPADQTVALNASASFKVVAVGASSYQWQWRAGTNGTWTDCSSATSGYNTATLKPVATSARNGYQYRCVVKNTNGNSVTSNAATLTVKAASGVSITTQPVSVSVTEGSTASFKVVATSASSYQWQWRAGSTGTWANCSSATTGYNTATLKPVGTAARNGYQYRCIVKDSSGKSVTSNAATLTVKAASGVSITTQPASTTVAEGSTATFKVVASGASSYQWQWRDSASGTWKDCSSATSGYNTATLKPVGTAARNGYQYRCIVKDANGKSVTSNTATLTVKAGLAITTQPASVSVTEGSTATFKVVATGASSYQWQWRTGSTGTWANCSSATSGYNTATLKPVGTAARNGYQYRCVVKDASGKSVTSNAATLTVKAGLAITTQPANASVTEGNTATFKVVASGASSYQWQWRTGSTGTWTNCSSATSGYNTATLKPVGTAARNGYQYRCIVKDANGNSVTSNTATLTVK